MSAAGRVALLGDSIFDNAANVPGQPAVITQVKAALPPGWEAVLLAVDGASAADVQWQVEQPDNHFTHLFLSAGGNDALNESQVLAQRVDSVGTVYDAIPALDAGAQTALSAFNDVILREAFRVHARSTCDLYVTRLLPRSRPSSPRRGAEPRSRG